MSNGSPVMMVEAKSLGTPLQDSVLAQGINYCLMEGTSYFSVTDGRLWEIYETHKPVPINDKRIVRFDLREDPAQVCLKALALWRPSVETGQVSAGHTPIVGLSQREPDIPQTPPIEEPVIQPESVVPVPDGVGWQPLSEFSPAPGSTRPTEVMFPDNSTVQIKNWKSIIVESTRWLVNKGFLDQSHCPVQLPSASARYIVHTASIHQSGKPFVQDEQVGEFYIETNAGSKALIQQTQRIIQHVGQDPAQFKVRLP